MNKEFLKLKNRPYFSSELSELISQLHLLGLPKNNQKKAQKAIFEFLLKVKENIYREVDREYFKEDVMTKIKEYYGVKGLKLAKAVPDTIIDLVIETWQDNLGNADTYCDVNWMVLEDVLSCEVWLDGIEKHNSREVGLYQIYLKDWFSKHTEGEPVSIDEFFNSEMQDEELKKSESCESQSKKGGMIYA